MNATSNSWDVRQIPVLLRGEPESVNASIERCSTGRVLLYCAVIFVGAGLYGAAVGAWRSPEQALNTALKFPLILLLITLGNALLNAMFAPLLGLNISFRQTLLAILMSFTIAAVILGSFGPLVFFIVSNLPPMRRNTGTSVTAHSFHLLTQVALIAFAGVAANLRLIQLLRRLSGSNAIARRILFAWLAGNLFLGSQLSWIFRPFIGSPGLPVEFLRHDALQGNFFESVLHAVQRLFTA